MVVSVYDDGDSFVMIYHLSYVMTELIYLSCYMIPSCSALVVRPFHMQSLHLLSHTSALWHSE